MFPVVALVGRPNVGKSTLFNRITQTRNALVADYPGLTRDRQYGDAKFNNKSFILVDTGGIGVDDANVDSLMSKQSAIAIQESDIVLLLVDARQGLLAIDEAIAVQLRKLGKLVFVVVNKVDGMDTDVASIEFQSLGFANSYAISATHGRGIDTLLEAVTKDFNEPEVEEAETSNAIKIACIGRPNVGKSTLINRILGENRLVVYDMPGTTRDSIAVPFKREETDYILIDTAGIRRRSRIEIAIEKFSVIKTLQSIKESNVCLLLLDAQEGVTEQDLHLLGYILDAGKGLVIVVNKWDGLTTETKETVKEGLSRKLSFINFAKIRFISALHGTGVGHLFKDIHAAYNSAMMPFSTPKLTRLLQEFVAQHPPPLVNSRRIKLRYAHAGGHNPPIIIIHGNQVASLPDSYKRYLSNAYIEHLKLVGTPLKIEFKGSENPYKGKKNVLSDRQKKHRSRLISRVKRRNK